MLLSTWMLWPHAASAQAPAPGSNPVIRDKFTADHGPILKVGDFKTLEHLRDNPDGSMKPVVQTEAGVAVPSE